MDNHHPDILQHAQRLRYEALSNFATELNKSVNYPRLAQALASHVKFIVDSYILRIHYRHKNFSKGFEVRRGESRIFNPREDILHPFDDELLTKSLPAHYTLDHVRKHIILSNSVFNHDRIVAVYFLPVSYFNEQEILVSVGIKSYTSAMDVDYKFLRLIADLVANKLYQLALLERIEKKNEQLEHQNKQIIGLNKDLEEMVTQRTVELTEANNELSTLFYRTSHDFRAPLANILGLANLARILTEDKEVLGIFDQCEIVIQRLDFMLQKLTALSMQHTSSGDRHAVDFVGVIEKVREKFQGRITELNAEMDVDIKLKQTYQANPDLIQVIFENLLENALTYHKGRPQIQIVIFQHKQDLVVKFSDNGQGMPPKIAARIFDMYYRGSVDSSGTGLGLYVVRKLVKILGGEVFVHSKHHHYTHFILRLPFKHIHQMAEHIMTVKSLHRSLP